MIVKSEEEKQILREGGKRLALVLSAVAKEVCPGISTKQLDTLAERLIRDGGDTPAFLNYQPDGATSPYPATLCTSVNSEVVHGIPKEDYILKKGDIIGLDIGLVHDGFVSDTAVTVPVGSIDKKIQILLDATREALTAGINAARAGGFTGDIGHEIEKIAHRNSLSVVRELGGHGVGRRVHEEPFVPNFGASGSGEKLVEGQVLALEPIFTTSNGDVILAEDGSTYKTKDNSLSAHFEHSILITENEAEILTNY